MIIEIETTKSVIAECDRYIVEYEKLAQKHNLIIKILTLLDLVAVICAGIYVYNDGSKWYFVLLAAFLAGMAAYAVGGLILLLCKPFLALNRKRLKEMLDEVWSRKVHSTNEKRYLLRCYIENTPPGIPNFDNVPRKQRFSIQKCYDYWVTEQDNVLQFDDDIRKLELEQARYTEWDMILTAVLILVLGVIFVIAIYLFFIAILLLLVYFAVCNSSKDKYDSYYDSDADSGSTDILGGIEKLITGRVKEKLNAVECELNGSKQMIRSHKEAANAYLDALINYYYPDMDAELIEVLRYK